MRTRAAFSCLLASFVLAACGTVPTKLDNVSPEPVIPEVPGFATIPATVVVRSEDPADKTPHDVVNVLTRQGVFISAVLAEPAKPGSHFVMVVKSTSKGEHHFSEGMGKAFVSGLTFGIASSSQVAPFDFEVTIDATVLRAGTEVARYQTVGRYHSEVARSAPLSEKTERVKKAVAGSFAHALGLLSAKIKRDRALYLAADGR